MLSKFKEAKIRAEICEEVSERVMEMSKNFKEWHMDDWELTLREFDAKQMEDETVEEDWSVKHARENYAEGEYRLEVYDKIIAALEKLL